MLTENGSLQLQDFTDRNFQEAFTQVTEEEGGIARSVDAAGAL